MDIEQVKQQHKEGLSKLGVLFSQKESIEEQIKSLKSQLLQLEAVQQWAESSQQQPTAPASPAPGDEA